MISDYKKCKNYSEELSDLFDYDPNITVVGCKINGIKALCIHKKCWSTCMVSKHDSFYRYKYRLQDRVLIHSQLFHIPYDRRNSDGETCN